MASSQMQLEDWLDDLCVRFIINLPEEDLSSVARICFQVEEAQWFYEDFIRPLDPSLPSMTLRTFCLRIFQHCPLLANFSVENHTKAFEEFLQYKTRIPVRGAILLNHDMDATVLVKGWKKGANWSFPRGKINKDEDDLDCAVREVWEETGLDLRGAGLVPTDSRPKYIEVTMREQQMRLYVFRDVPMDTPFQPQTRKEISKIEWYRLSELPAFRKKGANANDTNANAGPSANKFYMVAPFLVPLKKWVLSQKRTDTKRIHMPSNPVLNPQFSLDEAPTEDDSWPQPVAPIPMKAPAIETLEGATYELQRLLKVQPATQGLQLPSVQDDKASALLSMLKAKDHLPPPHIQSNPYFPQTPLEAGVAEDSQPRNPHHHNNQRSAHVKVHQPPPPFPIQPHQQGIQNNMAPNQHYQAHVPPQQYGNSQYQDQGLVAPLIHPQPLPPQVQRAVFNQSIQQESSPFTGAGLPVQTTQANYENIPQAPIQYSVLGTQGASAGPLDGRSMALLNAFRRTTDQQPPQQLNDQPQVVEQRVVPNQLPYFHQNATSQPIPPLSELTGSTLQHIAPNTVKAGPPATTDKHRSTLLGMFKNDRLDGASDPRPSPDTVAPGLRPQNSGNSTEKQLLGAMRAVSLGGDGTTRVPSQPSANIPNPSAALSDFLALKPRSEQQHPAAPKKQRANESAAVPLAARQASMPAQLPPSQPIRILQRGQGADGVKFPGHTDVPPNHIQQPMDSFPAASTAAPGVPPQHQAAAQSRRPEATPDQKRQLLSLFGSSQQSSSSSHDITQPKQEIRSNPALQLGPLPPNTGEAVYGHGRASRQSSTTPMSPAEQSFVLDYLQSVTNSATR